MKAIPFFPQERPESCVPACLRMVLAYHGLERTEAEIYACCETDVDGTLPSAVVRCVQNLGFDATTQRLPDIDILTEHLKTEDILPIVFMNLRPIRGINAIHAVVVETLDIQFDQIQVIDPAYPPTGRRTLSVKLFDIGWQLARRQTIFVKSRLI